MALVFIVISTFGRGFRSGLQYGAVLVALTWNEYSLMALQISLRVIFMVCTPIIPKAFGVTVKSVADMAALVKTVIPVEISATVTVTAEGFVESSGSTALAPPKLRVSLEFKGISGIGVGVAIKGMG